MRRIRIYAIVLAVLTLLGVILAGCSQSKSGGQDYSSMEELQGPGKVIALWQGCGYEEYLTEAFPEATADYGEYVADLGLKVRQGKADAMLLGETYFNYFHDELSDIVVLDGDLGTIEGALIFSGGGVGRSVQMQFNVFLDAAYSNGTVDELKAKWLGQIRPDQPIDLSGLDPEWPHIRVGVTNDEPPYAFMLNRQLAGYDAELLVRFCLTYHYYPDFMFDEYFSLVAAIQVDRYDVVAAGFEIVEERTENVLYSNPSRVDRVIVAVRGEGEKTDFIESVVKSFRRTFIEEERYRDFIDGIKVTLEIVVSSVIIGCVLGFVLYFLNRGGSRFMHGLTSVLSTILHRVPSIVLLMVLYYVILGSVNISAVIVSIILFTISFALSTYEAIQLAVSAVGKGQVEAAYTLGLTRNECFFKILLPQGRNIFLSGIKLSIVNIMLESSVVGYISVVDLTRVGDIIRNNTYEAFFPLIAVAVFYLLLSTLIIGLINYFEKRSDPKKRSREKVLKSLIGEAEER